MNQTIPKLAASTNGDDLLTACRARLAGNLSALAVHQPALAQQLAQTAVPANARFALGRDGAPVAILAEEPDAVRWLGGTSMPTISAPEVLGSVGDSSASVALASIGSGHEALLLAGRLSAHAAVFVCVADLSELLCALHVVDWSSVLRAGRIVILAGDIAVGLVEFLEAHPGYQAPARVQSLPDLPNLDFQNRAAEVQRGAQRADAAQQRLHARLTEQVARLRARTSRGHPRVLILSTVARPSTLELSIQAEGALSASGMASARCLPDGPGRCHRVARLAALRDHAPDWVLWMNATPGGLLAHWPRDLPFACWFFDDALPANALAGLAQCGNLFAATTDIAAQLAARGANPANVTVLEPGVDDQTFRPLRDEERGDAPRCEIAVFCDGHDVSPAAANIGLESHERLWAAAAEILSRDVRGGAAWPVTDADDLLRRAERSAGIQLSDAKLRGEYAGLLASRLIGAIFVRETVIALRQLAPVALWGAHWEKHEALRALHRGAIPGAAERNRIFQQAALVVFPLPGPVAVRGALETLAAGGCPITAHFAPAELARNPQSRQILSKVPSFASVADAVACAGRLLGDMSLGDMAPGDRALSDMACRRKTAGPLRAEILREHTLRSRLTRLYEKLTTSEIAG